jgi:hypothetical protein
MKKMIISVGIAVLMVCCSWGGYNYLRIGKALAQPYYYNPNPYNNPYYCDPNYDPNCAPEFFQYLFQIPQQLHEEHEEQEERERRERFEHQERYEHHEGRERGRRGHD